MFLVKKYDISGISMSPSLNPGDTVFASPLPYFFSSPRKNDIIICQDPRDKRVLVKRLVRIDNNKYFVAGDNPSSSTDSRTFGLINRRGIIGKVIYIKI